MQLEHDGLSKNSAKQKIISQDDKAKRGRYSENWIELSLKRDRGKPTGKVTALPVLVNMQENFLGLVHFYSSMIVA